MAKRAANLASRSVFVGWMTSALLHALVFVALGIDAVWQFLDLPLTAPRVASPVAAIEARLLDDELTVLPGYHYEARASRIALMPIEHPVELADLGLIANTQAADSEAATDRHAVDVFRERVDAKVGTAIQSAQTLSEDEQRERLQTLAGQLNRVSSERSLDDLAGRFQRWLGTDKRAEKPAEGPVPGEFDLSTAQLHDIRRERDEDGGFRYVSVLVDAAGRKLETPLDPIEGESTYKTFQLMKANPLAEMVYRRIAMSLLDNLIKASQKAQQALPVEPQPAEPLPPESLPAKPGTPKP